MGDVFVATVSILFDGFAYAMLLFMISVGLSVTMGLMGFVNLAHGAFAMAGGYCVVSLMNAWGFGFLPALLVAGFVVAALSLPFERILYRPLYRASELEQVLMSIGLVFMAVGAVTYLYGPQPPHVGLPTFLKGQIDLGFKTEPREGLGLSLSNMANVVRLGGTLADPGIRMDALKTGEAAARTAGAVMTGGLSLLGEGMYNRATADKTPCQTALEMK